MDDKRYDDIAVNIAQSLNVSPEFVDAYLETNQLGDAAVSALDYAAFLSSLSPLPRMYVEFALSTSLRGQEVLELITAQAGKRPEGRYLDIGCGYGGFVRMFASHGMDSIGVEVVPLLAEYSRLNCSGLANAKVIEGNFLAQDTASLGQFDVITCNDVIEHIEDPPEAIARIARLMKPGAILMMEIPNRACLKWLTADGHFQLFGISCLPREAAGRYFREHLDRDDYFGHMGEFYDYQVYLDLLAENGLEGRLLERHSVGTLEDLPAHAASALEGLANFVDKGSVKLQPLTRRSVQAHVADTVAEALTAYAESSRSGVRKATERRYMQTFWTLIAVRQ